MVTAGHHTCQKQIADVWSAGQDWTLRCACAVMDNNDLPVIWLILASTNNKQQRSKLQDECNDWANAL
eukprot:1308487-Ditylum_brightwellii.AAC.1